MLLAVTATVVAACFCLTPAPLPEQIPVTPDAFEIPVHAAVPADAVPERCLASARAWSRLAAVCPRMPVQPVTHAGPRLFMLGRVR